MMQRFNKIYQKVRAYLSQHSVRVFIVAYIVIAVLAITGRIMLDNVLEQYANEQLGYWADVVLYASIPDISDEPFEEHSSQGMSQLLGQVSYKIYRGTYLYGEEIHSHKIDEQIYTNDAIITFFKDASNINDVEHIENELVSVGDTKYTAIYLRKEIKNQVYTLCAYMPREIFLHNSYSIAIIKVYSAIMCVVSAIMLCMAFMFVQLWKLRESRQRESTQREIAEQSAKAQSDFLTRMSHEFRTPLNAILGMNEMIQREDINDKTREYASYIESAGQNLLSMVNEILDFAKMDAKKVQIIENEYYVADMAAEIKHIIELQAQKKGLEFYINVDTNLPTSLIGDYNHLKQIIINLCNNAVKYTETGEVTLHLNWIPDSTMQIIVSDTGVGISDKDIPVLFDQFMRSDMPYNQTTEGTGLGLAIVKRYAEMMGGIVRVESEVGKGSKFIVTVPQKKASEIFDTSAQLVSGETFVASDMRALFVDDTQSNLDVFTRLLAHTQMHIDIALSGKEALEKMHGCVYDLIVLDERMPEMSGLETYTQMQQQNLLQGAKVIMLTANASEDDKAKALGYGVDKYLVKPVPAHVLENTIYQLAPQEKVSKIAKPLQANVLPEWLINHPDITTAVGLEACGTASDYLESLSRFAEHAPARIGELKDMALAGDCENLTIKIHALKSSARMVGLLQLSKLAEELEEAGDRQDLSYIGMRAPELFQMYGSMAGEIQMRLHQHETMQNAEKETIDPEGVFGILNHLRGYVMDFNDEAINSMIHALSRYNFPGEIQPKFEEFKQAYNNVSWIEMQESIDELVEIAKQWKKEA